MSQNELESGAGLNQVLSKAFGVQGAAAPFMASEVFPTLVMGNDRPEWNFLSGDRLCAGAQSDAAVAAQISQVGLNNPAGSGVIIVVESVTVTDVTGGAARLYRLGLGIGATIDTATGAAFVDTRWGFVNTPTGDVYRLTQVARTGTTILTFPVAGAGHTTIKGPWVLAPDGFIVASGNGVASAIDASYSWREYAAADGELRNIAVA